MREWKKGTSHLKKYAKPGILALYFRHISRYLSFCFVSALRRAEMLSFKRNVRESVNQKINTLNFNNNKSSAQQKIPSINSHGDEKDIFSVSFSRIGLCIEIYHNSRSRFVQCSWKMSNMLKCKFASSKRSSSFCFIRCFNCLHICSRTEMMVFHSPPTADQFNFHDKNRQNGITTNPIREWKYKFRDLFAFVNGTRDKTNYKIFVNGPSRPEMHIACRCPQKYCLRWVFI